MLLRCTIASSAIAERPVVRVPRSRTERTPQIFSDRVELGTSLGGGEAASANGFADSKIVVKGTVSNVVRIVERVPPLGPEVLGYG